MDAQLLTSREAATYIGLSESYLRSLRSAGKIKGRVLPPPFVRIGQGRGGVRYARKDLDEWMDGLERHTSLNQE